MCFNDMFRRPFLLPLAPKVPHPTLRNYASKQTRMCYFPVAFRICICIYSGDFGSSSGGSLLLMLMELSSPCQPSVRSFFTYIL